MGWFTLKNKNHTYITILISLTLTLFSITSAVKLSIVFKPIYCFDINYLKLEKVSGLTKAEITKNYDYLINYLIGPSTLEFDLPSIPYSEQGKTHFEDVKKIFIFINYILTISFILLIAGIIKICKLRDFSFLKWTIRSILLLIAFIGSLFAINFNNTFDTFHKIVFTNDYWLFDPSTDPIINILPETFFLHSGLFILLLLFLMILFYNFLYKVLKWLTLSFIFHFFYNTI